MAFDIKEYRKMYNETHKEQKTEYNKRYYEKHKKLISDRHKKYYQENQQEIREKAKQWYYSHKKENQLYTKRWIEKNKEKFIKAISESKKRRVARLREQGCTNAWCVINNGAEPKYKAKENND